MRDATDSPTDYGPQPRPVNPGPPFGFETSRRRMTAVDLTAALLGAFTALGLLAVMLALLTSGIAGIDIFEAGKLERFATSTVTTTIVVVFAAFYCGGRMHGALRGSEKQGRHQPKSRAKQWWINLTYDALDVGNGHYDEFTGRIK